MEELDGIALLRSSHDNITLVHIKGDMLDSESYRIVKITYLQSLFCVGGGIIEGSFGIRKIFNVFFSVKHFSVNLQLKSCVNKVFLLVKA